MEIKMNIKPKTYTKLVNFKISPEEYEILKAIADSEKKSASELFRMFIHEKGKPVLDDKYYEYIKFTDADIENEKFIKDCLEEDK